MGEREGNQGKVGREGGEGDGQENNGETKGKPTITFGVPRIQPYCISPPDTAQATTNLTRNH